MVTRMLPFAKYRKARRSAGGSGPIRCRLLINEAVGNADHEAIREVRSPGFRSLVRALGHSHVRLGGRRVALSGYAKMDFCAVDGGDFGQSLQFGSPRASKTI